MDFQFTEAMDSDLQNSTNNSMIFNLFKELMDENNGNSSEEKKNQILIFTYSLIVIISLIGNLLVCKVILERKRCLSTTNALIANLAISDLMMTVINVPFNIARFVLPNWPFGNTLCVVLPFIQSVSVHCSSITMMFIAVERYQSLLYNTHINGNCFGKCFPFGDILTLIWLLSALFSIPHGIYNQLVYLKELDIIRCRVVYPEPKEVYKQRVTLISFLTQYIIPILLTVICYLRISVFLWRKEIVGHLTECHRISIMRRKKRRIKMLIIVVLVFAICWLPLNVFLLVNTFFDITYSSNLFFISHWFAMSSVCYNPFIYCWLNDNFKQRLRTLFTCFTFTNDRNNWSIFGSRHGIIMSRVNRSANNEQSITISENVDEITV